MGSISDDELEYLEPGFDISSLTVPRLRAILVEHDIQYPASSKKPQLVEIVEAKLIPRAKKILSTRARIRRTSRGITDMPSSQDGTADSEDAAPMPPPPTPRTPGRPRKSARATTEEGAEETPRPKKTPRAKSSSKHPRASDSEAGVDRDDERPVARKPRKSEIAPAVKAQEPVERMERPSLNESAFSHDNPFQSGSSPITGNEARRKSAGLKTEKRKSTSRRRRTEEHGPVKQENDYSVPTSKTFEVPVARLRESRVKAEAQDELEPGEEFTPEEQQALIQEGAARGEVDVLRPRRKKAERRSRFPTTAPWAFLTTVLAGYAAWYRKEKIEVGYCGIGKQITALEELQAPEWTAVIQPQCEPCPQHGICYDDFSVRCEPDFVLIPHPLSLGGLVPLPPTCQPDGEKVRKIQAVADKAVNELRERRAKWECGELSDDGKPATAVEIDESALKAEVSQKRRKGMSETEFEDLWKGALGEIVARDEVTSDSDGSGQGLRLASSSLARIPIGCAIRRSARLTVARYRSEAAGLVVILSLFAYIRSRIRRTSSDKARVPGLVASTLDRLATQAALFAQGGATEGWISVGQMRDDVLREEFSAKRREEIWVRVKQVVEMNANVRASVKEGRLGEVSRVWEWIGGLPALEDRRQSGRYSLGPAVDTPERSRSPPTGLESRQWDEGRPIY